MAVRRGQINARRGAIVRLVERDGERAYAKRRWARFGCSGFGRLPDTALSDVDEAVVAGSFGAAARGRARFLGAQIRQWRGRGDQITILNAVPVALSAREPRHEV